MTFIHYGSKHFDREMFERPIVKGETVRGLNKPLKGLWGSPVDSNRSWRDFCLNEDFNVSSLNRHFLFKLKDSARVLKVLDTRDLAYVYHRYGIRGSYGRVSLDWNRIAKSYDAMVLMMPNDFDVTFNLNLCSWDVDSVIVFNPDSVVELPRRNRVR